MQMVGVHLENLEGMVVMRSRTDFTLLWSFLYSLISATRSKFQTWSSLHTYIYVVCILNWMASVCNTLYSFLYQSWARIIFLSALHCVKLFY